MRHINAIAVAIFLVVVLVLFALTPRHTEMMQARFLGIIAPLLKNGSLLQKQIIGFREGMKTLNQLDAENKQLRVELDELKATDQTLQGLAAENNQLRRALQYRERSAFKLVPARIIARDAATWWSTIKSTRGRTTASPRPAGPHRGWACGQDHRRGRKCLHRAPDLRRELRGCGECRRNPGARDRARDAHFDRHGADLTLGLLSKLANLKPGPEGLLIRGGRAYSRPGY